MDIDAYLARYTTAVQAHCPDRVLAVGLLCRPGAVANALLGQVSGLWALLRDRKARTASGGLPRNVVAAVTSGSIELFDYRHRSSGIKIRQRVASWPRVGLRIEADAPGTLSQRLRFHLIDGSTVELDVTRGPGSAGRVNEPFLHELGLLLAV